MESTPIQRFREWLKSSEYSQSDIARALNVSKQNVNMWVKSSRDIKLDTLKKLKSSFPELNVNWIITGEGEMFTQ